MAFTFSKRSAKYVWFCLPGLFTVGLVGAWGLSIAPDMQAMSMGMVQWRQEKTQVRQRQQYLSKNPVHSDYAQLILSGTSKADTNLPSVIPLHLTADLIASYQPGQVIRLLDQHHQCIGYLVTNRGVYLGSVCDASIPEVPKRIGGTFVDIPLEVIN